MERRPSVRPWLLDSVLVAAAGAYVAALASTSTPPGIEPTSYAAASSWAHATDLVAGIGLLAAGIAARTESRTRRLSPLLMLAGVLWFAPDWDGWEGGPALVRSLGAAWTPVYVAVIFHVARAAPGGSLRSRAARRGVTAVYVISAVAGLAIAVVHDPFRDPYCWRNCVDNVFAVHPDQALSHALQQAWTATTALLGVLIVVIATRRAATASRAARGTMVPFAVPSLLIGMTVAAHALWLLHTPLEQPQAPGFLRLYVLQGLATVGLALGAVVVVIRDRRTRAAVAQLALDVSRSAGTFETALAHATGDATVDVAYWLPASRRYVDANGATRAPPVPAPGREVTSITRNAQTLALVGHMAKGEADLDLEHEIGASARLALENERLRAEALAQLEDLRASLTRVVDTGDAERRRLERNLHDGAQQRLLAVSFELRLACAGLGPEDAALAAELGDALQEVDESLNDLRELAHGIYPAVLTEAGLAAAISTLADVAPLPVELGALATERHPEVVERGAYVAVAEAIDDAVSRSATGVSVEVSTSDHVLTVRVWDDGRPRESVPEHIADRVGALGGRATSKTGTLLVVLPCG
jgi:signal transduction histidine kinase